MPKTVEKEPTEPTEPKNFESAMTEIDTLVEKMEAGQLPLEESLASYQRGTALLRYCEKVLAEAEQRIQILAPTPDGAGTLKDFEQ